jgi:hypothetical protein
MRTLIEFVGAMSPVLLDVLALMCGVVRSATRAKAKRSVKRRKIK